MALDPRRGLAGRRYQTLRATAPGENSERTAGGRWCSKYPRRPHMAAVSAAAQGCHRGAGECPKSCCKMVRSSMVPLTRSSEARRPAGGKQDSAANDDGAFLPQASSRMRSTQVRDGGLGTAVLHPHLALQQSAPRSLVAGGCKQPILIPRIGGR